MKTHDTNLARRLYSPAPGQITAEILAGSRSLCETAESLVAIPSLKAIDAAMGQADSVRANLQRLRIQMAGGK